MKKEELYMRRCIQLAKNGARTAAPNPVVGAVIVHEGRIIGEGYHIHCGEAHAEVNAIRSVKEINLLKESTIYVSLEPCSHYGKTPPCADLILQMQIPRVVIGCQDPFPQVAGRGIRKLRDGGCEVEVGVLENECLDLIHRFITFHTRKRPYITLKWAESADGFIDIKREGGSPVIFSTAHSAMLSHQRRAYSKAILVGRKTALLDNPSLNVRHWKGDSPLRIVIDRQLVLPQNLHLFDNTLPTLVFNEKEEGQKGEISFVRINFSTNILPQLLRKLYDMKVQSLLVEGGTQTIQAFIDSSLWDEIFIEKSSKKISNGITAPSVPSLRDIEIKKHFGCSFFHYLAPKQQTSYL